MIRPISEGDGEGESPSESGLVDVGNYPTALSAEIDKARLQGDGIDAFVFDGMFASATLIYTNAIGGVRLKVRKRDRERAKALLAEVMETGEDTFAEEKEIDFSHSHCPACHGVDLESTDLPREIESWFRPWVWVTGLFSARRECRCRTCGHGWRE
jgi:hypothetical protein